MGSGQERRRQGGGQPLPIFQLQDFMESSKETGLSDGDSLRRSLQGQLELEFILGCV